MSIHLDRPREVQNIVMKVFYDDVFSSQWAAPHVCVFCQTPVHAVYLNHEVVAFQTRTVTTPDLGSVANITTILYLPPCLFQPCSGSSFPPPPGPISYLSPIFHPSMPLLSLFAPASTLPSRPGAEQPSIWMAPTPTGLP